ncbi:Urb2/Npa2 family-domain-containing protein [Calycina marina]|uniref:Urb2/Npa2 family-domain-containing protein n=1 Tax=Calycina marina TaxID=1763456 RepID=A0A9P7YZV1_9HELO|nr:Urb2/Npa2 family-domain-containing protein [Calycina marina]
MTFKSRLSQEQLVQLEKSAAKFEDQLLEAAKFIGLHSNDDGRLLAGSKNAKKTSKTYGKEEWLLRWLLKKLQAPKDEVPRRTASAWSLLAHLIQVLPTTNTAHILSERKFLPILRQTLEEAEKLTQDPMKQSPAGNDSNSKEWKYSKKSKKRKRSGELVGADTNEQNATSNLLAAIHIAVESMTILALPSVEPAEEDSAAVFSAEFMKLVLRTLGDDSARILGLWLSLSGSHHIYKSIGAQDWISPFIWIWELRFTGSEDLMHFSLHCFQSLLQLLQLLRGQDPTADHDWVSKLEQLVARNIMIPAKATWAENPESDLLSILTKLSIVQQSSNAPLLFEIAIISIQTQATRKRQENYLWIQHVFTTLREAMPVQRIDENGEAAQRMLDIAIKYKVRFELPILYSIVSEFGMLATSTNWTLLSTIIRLDANTFLIQEADKDLSDELLKRITEASVQTTWAVHQRQIVDDVVVPLMGEFAKARDLSGFVRHWFRQVVEFEKLRKQSEVDVDEFSAWEDEALQKELGRLLEPSLTVQQLLQLVEWTAGKIPESTDASCLILEAISGSVKSENFIDAVGPRLINIILHNAKLAPAYRHRWRSWRLLSRTLSWIQPSFLEEFSHLAAAGEEPFDALNGVNSVVDYLMTTSKRFSGLESLEFLRCACTAWMIAPEASEMKTLTSNVVLNLLQRLADDVKSFVQDLISGKDLGNESCSLVQNKLSRGEGWLAWASIHCVFVENTAVLRVVKCLPEGSFQEMVQNIFWVASTLHNDRPTTANTWLHLNSEVFPSLWLSVLSNRLIQDDENLREHVINVALLSQTNSKNPLMQSHTNNKLAVQSLLTLPLDDIPRRHRERIMKAWLPDKSDGAGISFEPTALDAQVLALKVKIMHRPTLHESINFKELVSIADSIAGADPDGLDVNITLLKQLARLTLLQVSENLDQTRNRSYAVEAIDYVTKKLNKEKSKHSWNAAARVALFDAALSSLQDKHGVLNDLDIINKSNLDSLLVSFEKMLLAQLHKVFEKPANFTRSEKTQFVTVACDALTAMKVNAPRLEKLSIYADRFILSLGEAESDLKMRVGILLSTISEDYSKQTASTTGSVMGRQSIRAARNNALKGTDSSNKLGLLKSTLQRSLGPSNELDNLLATKYTVAACDDARGVVDEDDEDMFDLSSAYSDLCSRMWKVNSYREFAVIAETLVVMLRSKGRAISQWNVDSTLGCISIVCSRRGPSFRPSQAGNVYMQLCRLVHTILISHRLKLEGHFHLVAQTVESLLRCLFTPLQSTNTASSKTFVPPRWLPTTSSSPHQLNIRHAAAFTRLLTLICNPTVSSVTRSQNNALTSATDKAKRMAGQHMQYVLMAYVRLQLEMRMLTAVREQLVPGIYAIFDTTTPELRRAINEGMDGSGRAVFRNLYTDYTKFGKWKGS